MRNAVISGLWANTNLDDEKEGEGRRAKIMEEVIQGFDDSIISVYTGVDPEKKQDIDWEDPFFAAVKRGEAAQQSASTEKYDIDQSPSD